MLVDYFISCDSLCRGFVIDVNCITVVTGSGVFKDLAPMFTFVRFGKKIMEKTEKFEFTSRVQLTRHD